MPGFDPLLRPREPNRLLVNTREAERRARIGKIFDKDGLRDCGERVLTSSVELGMFLEIAADLAGVWLARIVKFDRGHRPRFPSMSWTIVLRVEHVNNSA